MTFLFVILGVFLALVSSGYSLRCMDCLITGKTSCTGQSFNCFPGYVCGATYMSTISSNNNLTIYRMSCVPENQCSSNGSARYGNTKKMKMATSCCTTDNCIPALPSLPADNSVPNGLTCPSCVQGLGCSMQCTGDENMCLLQTITTEIPGNRSESYGVTCPGCEVPGCWCPLLCTGEENLCLTSNIGRVVHKVSERGCTTKSICNPNKFSYSVYGISRDFYFNCSSESNSGLQTRFYLPTAICLLFLKLLFIS